MTSAADRRCTSAHYDTNGNLLNKKRYAYVPNGGTLGACLETISYGYDAAHQDWADQLTSYNGEAIRYDDSGNPISYRGYTMAWQGKRLTSATKTGTAVSYSYDENGIRTQKTVNNVTTNYYYNGSVLISQVSGNDTLLFSYDASGSVVSVNFNGTDYYYVRNGQGDVVKLIDGSGNTVTEYAYDTWGKLLSCTGSLSTTLGTLNPFRYRGYVYDTETGWYYLQSRYYDPEVCRFISADVLLSTGQGVLGHNTYAYCLNNPVNRRDPSGCASEYTEEQMNRWKKMEERGRHLMLKHYVEYATDCANLIFRYMGKAGYDSGDLNASKYPTYPDEGQSLQDYFDIAVAKFEKIMDPKVVNGVTVEPGVEYTNLGDTICDKSLTGDQLFIYIRCTSSNNNGTIALHVGASIDGNVWVSSMKDFVGNVLHPDYGPSHLADPSISLCYAIYKIDP